jgi:hypothetical protein
MSLEFQPIILSPGNGNADIVIGCVEEAAYELLTDWPADENDTDFEAIKTCLLSRLPGRESGAGNGADRILTRCIRSRDQNRQP